MAMALHSGIKFNILNKEKVCNCGHPEKYHIHGLAKCLFGMCGCDHFN